MTPAEPSRLILSQSFSRASASPTMLAAYQAIERFTRAGEQIEFNPDSLIRTLDKGITLGELRKLIQSKNGKFAEGWRNRQANMIVWQRPAAS